MIAESHGIGGYGTRSRLLRAVALGASAATIILFGWKLMWGG